jgi:hypothetical protein
MGWVEWADFVLKQINTCVQVKFYVLDDLKNELRFEFFTVNAFGKETRGFRFKNI